jgi:hypothetical protein
VDIRAVITVQDDLTRGTLIGRRSTRTLTIVSHKTSTKLDNVHLIAPTVELQFASNADNGQSNGHQNDQVFNDDTMGRLGIFFLTPPSLF